MFVSFHKPRPDSSGGDRARHDASCCVSLKSCANGCRLDLRSEWKQNRWRMRQSEFVSAMEWTHDEILLFIDDYRNSELLWDPRVPDYKDNKKKTTTIRTLAKKYNVTEDFIRKKIKNLRSAFHREHKTLMMQRKSHRQTKAKWFAYQSLSFLLEIDPTKTEYSTEEYHSSEVRHFFKIYLNVHLFSKFFNFKFISLNLISISFKFSVKA